MLNFPILYKKLVVNWRNKWKKKLICWEILLKYEMSATLHNGMMLAIVLLTWLNKDNETCDIADHHHHNHHGQDHHVPLVEQLGCCLKIIGLLYTFLPIKHLSYISKKYLMIWVYIGLSCYFLMSFPLSLFSNNK